jgi:hypothetical protein
MEENIFALKTIMVRDDIVAIKKQSIREVHSLGYSVDLEDVVNHNVTAYMLGLEKSCELGLVMACSNENDEIEEYAFRGSAPARETYLREFMEMGSEKAARMIAFSKNSEEGM